MLYADQIIAPIIFKLFADCFPVKCANTNVAKSFGARRVFAHYKRDRQFSVPRLLTYIMYIALLILLLLAKTEIHCIKDDNSQHPDTPYFSFYTIFIVWAFFLKTTCHIFRSVNNISIPPELPKPCQMM
jgi:hypothetical protein